MIRLKNIKQVIYDVNIKFTLYFLEENMKFLLLLA